MRCRSCNEEYDDRSAGADATLCEPCERGDIRSEVRPADEFRECPACAEPIRVRAKICRFCGHDLASRSPRTGGGARSHARRGPTPLAKSPALAACLSFLFSGLGQIYCGLVARGLLIMLAPFVLVWVVILGGVQTGLLLLLYVALLVFYVWQIFDAYQCAERANRGSPHRPRPRRRSPGARRRARAKRRPIS